MIGVDICTHLWYYNIVRGVRKSKERRIQMMGKIIHLMDTITAGINLITAILLLISTRRK